MGSRLTLALTLLSVTIAASHATAQEPVKSFAELAPTVNPDLRIQVTDSRDHETTGLLTSISNGTVTLTLPSGQTKSFAEQDVRRIDERKEFDGIGTMVGTGLGVLAGWFFAHVCDTPGCSAPSYLGWMALGGGLGVTADVKRMYKPLFIAPNKHARFRISPWLTPQQTGVMATLQF